MDTKITPNSGAAASLQQRTGRKVADDWREKITLEVALKEAERVRGYEGGPDNFAINEVCMIVLADEILRIRAVWAANPSPCKDPEACAIDQVCLFDCHTDKPA